MGIIKKKKAEREVERIPVAEIRPNPHQPRTVFESEALSALADSIGRYGILQPISVRAEKDGYEIIAGERRFRAACLAGMDSVPCLVYTVDGETGAELAVMENLLREDLNLFETAAAIDSLCREFGMTQEQVAERLSVSQSYVANKLRLLRFDAAMRKKILDGGLTERHARALLRLPPTLWEKTASRMIDGKYNVAAAEKLVEEMLGNAERRQVKKGRGKNKGVMRDLRLFYNSVDRAMEMVRRCGVAVKSRKEEREGEICLIISIPKTS
ncbi:MAG: ParB/RepB/Spo0J family partition protein [Clostridia bacterium]|nr:ParB/RepB/Spo0J family partition protein [Clostridia bacterium]